MFAPHCWIEFVEIRHGIIFGAHCSKQQFFPCLRLATAFFALRTRLFWRTPAQIRAKPGQWTRRKASSHFFIVSDEVRRMFFRGHDAGGIIIKRWVLLEVIPLASK